MFGFFPAFKVDVALYTNTFLFELAILDEYLCYLITYLLQKFKFQFLVTALKSILLIELQHNFSKNIDIIHFGLFCLQILLFLSLKKLTQSDKLLHL